MIDLSIFFTFQAQDSAGAEKAFDELATQHKILKTKLYKGGPDDEKRDLKRTIDFGAVFEDACNTYKNVHKYR